MERQSFRRQRVVSCLDAIPAQRALADARWPSADAAYEILDPVIADRIAGKENAAAGDVSVAKNRVAIRMLHATSLTRLPRPRMIGPLFCLIS